MMDWIDLLNFALVVAGLTVVLLGMVMSRSVPYLDGWTRRFFTVFFGLLGAYVGSDLLSQISLQWLGEGFAALSRGAIFLESLFSSLLMPLLTVYLLYCAGENRRKSPALYVVCTLWVVYFVLLILTQFTTAIYTVTDRNMYQRGPWYPLLLAPAVLLMAVNLVALVHYGAALSRRQRKAFAVYLIVPLACMLVQMAVYGLLMIVIGTCVAALFLFLFMMWDQMDRYIAQHEENARLHFHTMVLQMRPHFLYNVMNSIYFLIQQDPEKAQQVTRDFTIYLRQNFTAIVKEHVVPFTEELEHARAYLAVEKSRYEDTLFVEWDTPFINFSLPPLTLQPIVENAVKHGISPELGPLYISVLTQATDSGGRIIVEDTGLGFAPADNDRPHIALANIRERLEQIGGTLTIEQRSEGGTRVILWVPFGDTPPRA